MMQMFSISSESSYGISRFHRNQAIEFPDFIEIKLWNFPIYIGIKL